MHLKFKVSFCLLVVLALTACMSNRHVDKKMTGLLRCKPVDATFVFCDTLSDGEESCYHDYRGQRYLKRDNLFFSKSGDLNSVRVFKAEGVIEYSNEELRKDSTLLILNGWKIKSQFRISGDSITFPFKAVIIENDERARKIYSFEQSSDQTWLYVIEY